MTRRRTPLISALVLWALAAEGRFTAQAANVRQLGPEGGRVSSFEDPGSHSYIRFRNVQLTESGLIYYHDPTSGAALPPSNLGHILTLQYWDEPEQTLNVQVVTAQNRSLVRDRCIRWVDKSTFVFSGLEWEGTHIYHFFLDSFVPFFSTAIQTGILKLDAFWHREELPTSEEAPLQIIHRRPGSLSSKWRNVFDHITPDRYVYPNGVGACYSDLVLGVDGSLRTYGLTTDAGWQETQRAWMHHFQTFAIKAQHRSEALRYGSAPAWQLPGPLKGRKANIGWVSRPRTKYNSRAVVNEVELVAQLQAHYGAAANVSTLYFNGSLTQAMQDVSQLDVLVGVHGAGLTNVLWMAQGKAIVQLTPYGWDLGDGRYQAVEIIQQMVLNMNCSHHLWVNKRAEHSYFVEHDFEVEQHTFRAHPDPNEPLPGLQWLKGGVPRYWMFADTWVDVATLIPVIDEALQAVKARQ